MTQPTPAEPFPQPIELPGGPHVADDPTGLRYDRGDLEEPTTTRQSGAGWPVTGRGITVPDLLCGHLPGDVHDDSCDYWRGVALGEYPAPDGLPGHTAPVIARPPFNLRELAARGITAAEQDRRERGAAA